MSVPSSGSLLAGSLFALILANASACQQYKKPDASPGMINKAPNGSARFVYDGRRMVPAKLHSAPAEALYEGNIGGFVLPKLGDDELIVVFRDNRRQEDTVYRVNSGRGELVYFFNNNNHDREITTDHQLVFDSTDGRLQSVDIYRRDLGDELFRAFEIRDLTMMSRLLNANPSLSKAPYTGGMTLLMLADDIRIAKMAIDAGAEVNAKDLNGNTALHYAAYYGSKEVAELLVAHKADMDAKNFYGETPLHYAVQQGHRIVAIYLDQKGASGGVKNGRGQTPLGIELNN